MTNQRAVTPLLIEESKRENELFLSTQHWVSNLNWFYHCVGALFITNSDDRLFIAGSYDVKVNLSYFCFVYFVVVCIMVLHIFFMRNVAGCLVLKVPNFWTSTKRSLTVP